MNEWVCFLLLHSLLSSSKITQPRQYTLTFCPHSAARGKSHARARVCRSKTKPLPSSIEKKEKGKNSYITGGIKGPVYSPQVALSGGAAYKESYLVIFVLNQTCNRPGSFWCGRKYIFCKQGACLWVCSQASLFLSRHAGIIH